MLKACSRIARRKADKHDRIAVLTRAMLDYVADVVSKTLSDRRVDDAEFSLVIVELDRYRALKDEIRRSALPAHPNGGIDVAAMEAALRERLREELAAVLRDKITASTATFLSTASSSKCESSAPAATARRRRHHPIERGARSVIASNVRRLYKRDLRAARGNPPGRYETPKGASS